MSSMHTHPGTLIITQNNGKSINQAQTSVFFLKVTISCPGRSIQFEMMAEGTDMKVERNVFGFVFCSNDDHNFLIILKNR